MCASVSHATPLREALKILATEGIVRLRPNRAAEVVVFSEAETERCSRSSPCWRDFAGDCMPARYRRADRRNRPAALQHDAAPLPQRAARFFNLNQTDPPQHRRRSRQSGLVMALRFARRAFAPRALQRQHRARGERGEGSRGSSSRRPSSEMVPPSRSTCAVTSWKRIASTPPPCCPIRGPLLTFNPLHRTTKSISKEDA